MLGLKRIITLFIIQTYFSLTFFFWLKFKIFYLLLCLRKIKFPRHLWYYTLKKYVVTFDRGCSLFSSVQFSCSVVSDSLQPHGLQHTRLPCPSPTPRAYSNSCPLSQWCHPTISSYVVPFSSCHQSFSASGSFTVSQLFASSGQSIGVSASTSVLPVNIQGWPPLGLTGWISLQSKGLSTVVFSNTTVQKHQFFSAQLSL